MKDRVPTYPGRVRLTPVSGQPNVYDMGMNDLPTEVGTPLNKELFDHFIAAYGSTSGTASALVLNGDGGFVLSDGATIKFRLHVDSGATPTINVNNTGAKALMANKNKPMKASTPKGTWITATYCSEFDFFVLQGSSVDKLNFGNDPGQISSIQWLLYSHITDISRFIGGY